MSSSVGLQRGRSATATAAAGARSGIHSSTRYSGADDGGGAGTVAAAAAGAAGAAGATGARVAGATGSPGTHDANISSSASSDDHDGAEVGADVSAGRALRTSVGGTASHDVISATVDSSR